MSRESEAKERRLRVVQRLFQDAHQRPAKNMDELEAWLASPECAMQ
jgi:hypothetical protein